MCAGEPRGGGGAGRLLLFPDSESHQWDFLILLWDSCFHLDIPVFIFKLLLFFKIPDEINSTDVRQRYATGNLKMQSSAARFHRRFSWSIAVRILYTLLEKYLWFSSKLCVLTGFYPAEIERSEILMDKRLVRHLNFRWQSYGVSAPASHMRTYCIIHVTRRVRTFCCN